MNGVELANVLCVTQSSISRKTAKATINNEKEIVIGGLRYAIRRIGGRWDYEEVTIEEAKIKRVDEGEEKSWLEFPLEKRVEAELRAELIKKYEARENGETMESFLGSLGGKYKEMNFSRRQFLRWVQLVRNTPPQKSPLLKLIDKRGVSEKKKGVNDEILKEIERMILEKPHRQTRAIYRYLQKEHKDIPSYETIRNYVKEWKKEKYLLFEFAKNPDKAVGKYRPAGGNMSEAISFCNELWELDATPADVICADGKRYTLSAALDVFSRRVVIVVEETSNYTTLAKVLRKGIKRFGVPVAVKTDNGKDYTSNNFAFACSRLRINQLLTPPFSGYAKPHVERFFKTLSHELFEELDGYIGHNVADRGALQSQKMFSHKLESIAQWRERYKNGDEFAGRFALKKENHGVDVGVPLSVDELRMWIDKWIEVYESRTHSGIKTSPMAKWKSDTQPVKTVSDERMLDILLGFSIKRTIRKKGVEWNGVIYFHEEMADKVGSEVWLLSDDDMGKVYVYDIEMNYLFTALNPEYHNVSRSHILNSTKKWTKLLSKTIKGLDELRAEAPDRMKSLLEIEDSKPKNNTQVVEILEQIREKTEQEETKESVEAKVTLNGRPIFKKFYDRFLWDLENNMVDIGTNNLAEKYPVIWEMAEKEHKRRA